MIPFPRYRKNTNRPVTQRAQSRYLMLVALVGALVLAGQMVWVSKNQHRFFAFAIERIKCDHCQGTGRVPIPGANNQLQMCPACNGIGNHAVRRFTDREFLCPACEGMGRVREEKAEPERWRTCRRCDGRGIVAGGELEESPASDEPETAPIP